MVLLSTTREMTVDGKLSAKIKDILRNKRVKKKIMFLQKEFKNIMAVRTKIVPYKNLQHIISNLHTFFFLQYDYNNWVDLMRAYIDMRIYDYTSEHNRALWNDNSWLVKDVTDQKKFDNEVEEFINEQSKKDAEEEEEEEEVEEVVDENVGDSEFFNVGDSEFFFNIYTIMIYIKQKYRDEFNVFRTAVIDTMKYYHSFTVVECETDTAKKTVKCRKCHDKPYKYTNIEDIPKFENDICK